VRTSRQRQHMVLADKGYNSRVYRLHGAKITK
jgi:hypothetical protein